MGSSASTSITKKNLEIHRSKQGVGGPSQNHSNSQGQGHGQVVAGRKSNVSGDLASDASMAQNRSDINDDSTFTSPTTSLRQSFLKNNAMENKLDSSNPNIDTDFDESGANKLKPSIELIENVPLEDTSADNFISKLKSGDLAISRSSEFRARRLSNAVRTDSHSETIPILLKARNRTTVFASNEMGVTQEKKSPFSPHIFGTYSCHGIEPARDGSSEILEKINQDRGCVVYPFNASYNQALFLVLDGHGQHGDQVSEFVMRQIVISIEKHPLLVEDPVRAMHEAFVTTNAALQTTSINYAASGTTCVAVYIVGKKMYVANVGDSRVVLGKQKRVSKSDPQEMEGLIAANADPSVPSNTRIVASDLSRDHKPDAVGESDRIKASGGHIRPPLEAGLSARVYLDPKFTMVGLAMSRSIGDYAVKSAGVIAEPEIDIYNISPEDKYIVLASDGVWEFISSQAAIDIVHKTVCKMEALGGDQAEESALAACQELILHAALQWRMIEGDYRDDITAIVIRLPLPLSDRNSNSVSTTFSDN